MMPAYLSLINFTAAGRKTMTSTLTRSLIASLDLRRHGGCLSALYWLQGPHDIVAITQWPSDEAAAAFFMKLAMPGEVVVESYRAFDAGEMTRITRRIES